MREPTSPHYLPETGLPLFDRRGPKPIERGMRASSAAGCAWTDEEKKAVDAAIAYCAGAIETFTTDDVWKRIPWVPVTKGIGARLGVAARRGLIRNSGRVTTPTRGGRHDHAQRLTIWESVR